MIDSFVIIPLSGTANSGLSVAMLWARRMRGGWKTASTGRGGLLFSYAILLEHEFQCLAPDGIALGAQMQLIPFV